MWKSKFRRRAPSTRCCPRNYICPISTPSTRCCPQNSVCSMARVEVHAGLAAIAYPNSLVDFHAATDAWSRVCWPLGMTTILPVTRVTGRASSRPAILRSRSGLRKRRGELRGGREGSRSARRQAARPTRAGTQKCFKCESFSPQSSATGRRHGDGVRGVSQAWGGTYQGRYHVSALSLGWSGA